MKTVVFFNNKGGVGKTSLVYHLAWMYAEMGVNVVAADLDPQANLTSMFLEEERLEKLWPDAEHSETILGALRPILRGKGDFEGPFVESLTPRLGLIPGDLGLSRFEDKLSDAWPRCLDKDEAAFRATSALFRILAQAARLRQAELVLIDVGPNLGAINRSAIIAARYVTIPLASDLYSLQGLRNLGPALREWREQWRLRKAANPDPDLQLPQGEMDPAGYIVMQYAARGGRPVQAYGKWMGRIPGEYRESVLAEQRGSQSDTVSDPYCLASLRNFRSLMPMAIEARKPMFFLKPADGAIGGHQAAVVDCFRDFELLAQRIAQRCGIALPSPRHS